MNNERPTLGVMALYRGKGRTFEERRFLQKLMIAGEQMGFHIFLFTPEDVNDKTKKIYAYYYDQSTKRWRRKMTSFPDLIFDRCRYQPTPRFRKLREFRMKYPHLNYLNRPLANKWVIHRYLSTNPRLHKYLPETRLVKTGRDVLRFLNNRQSCFLKPINGTGGRSILQIEKVSINTYRVKGRSASRKIIPVQRLTAHGLSQAVARWMRTSKREFIAQQGIDLRLKDGRVHDFRLLIQKNGSGKWEVTGCAARIGARRSVTSNLHGGGRAVKMETLLHERFSSREKRARIQQEIHQLAHQVVHELELKYRPMIELALDIAVDRRGHPWLLEINPKPAREVFAQIGERHVYEQAIARPLEYALWKAASSTTE